MRDSVGAIFRVFLTLGLSSFGGPIAHLGYFRREFVERRKWLTESAFADLVALCQFLPGPASSQVGFAVGLSRGGLLGGLAAWAAFDGYETATMNFQSFSQIAFAFRVTPALLATAMIYPLVMGLFGGMLPAIRAARLPVVTALREL